MEQKIPQTIQTDHEELHEELARAMKAGGRTAEAARAVMKVMQPHMAREEEFVLPALALLGPLSAGRFSPDMAAVVAKTDALKAEMPRMLAEHGRIVVALKNLMQAATEERQTGCIQFAQRVIVHAQGEEEVLYPAAILVGEYLKLKLGHS
jgi:hemerythrin superfamily protein